MNCFLPVGNKCYSIILVKLRTCLGGHYVDNGTVDNANSYCLTGMLRNSDLGNTVMRFLKKLKVQELFGERTVIKVHVMQFSHK